MFENTKVRWSLILFVLALSIFWLTPNFMDTKTKSYLPKTKIVKGLDIQGGIHLVLGVDIEAYMRDKMQRLAKTFKEDLAKENIPYSDITTTMVPRPAFIVKSAATGDIQKAKDYINKNFPGTFQAIDTNSNEVQFSYYENTERELKSQVVKQAIEVIRNRIDSYGTLEPNIAAQGDDRILVQLPGIEDSQKAKDLINTTAKLEFMIVDDAYDITKLQTMIDEAEKKGNYTLGKTEANGLEYSDYVKRINVDLASLLPANREVVFQKPDAVESMTQSRSPLLVKNDEIVTGGMVEEAFVSKDPQSGRPIVSFQMSVDGRKPFGDLTGKNVKARMAIVLDKVMKTAPVLQSKISDSGQITLGSNNYQQMFDEAEFISRTLRAGALPASLQQLEERTVGPTLGSDSVKKGEFAGLVGCGLIFIFMVLYYGMLGMVANIALGINVVLILAILSTLGATLTLPGIAGIVLTVGMAVDANVIIFERIKDELREGKGINLAIKNGFDSAFSAIIDSNVTTAITCVMLIQFGTGAVRGFAVTLIIGVITSLFTAVFVSKTLSDVITQNFKFKKVVRF